MYLLNIEKLKFSYGENTVLRNVSLKVGSSEFIGIIGPNGAGKSTLLKLVDGIYNHESGQIMINNEYIESIPRKNLARTIAYLPQEIDLTFAYSVEEIVKMGRFPHLHGIRIYSDKDEAVVRQVMDLLDKAGLHNVHADNLALELAEVLE